MQRTVRSAPRLVRRARSLSFAAAPLTASSLDTTTLSNGVVVASQPFAGPVVSMGVYTDVGSRAETAATSGLSSVVSKAKVLEAGPKVAVLGGTLKASVTRDGTSYTATVLASAAAEAAAVLAECVSKPPSEAAFKEAAAAALSAVEAGVGSSEAAMLEEVHSCAFLETQFGAPTQGTAASLAAFTAAEAPPPSSIKAISVGGGDALAKALGALPSVGAKSGAVAAASTAPVFTGSDKKISMESLPHATIALAYEFPTMDSEFAPACVLMPELLGSVDVASDSAMIEPINLHAKCARDLAEQECVVKFTPFYVPYRDSALFGATLQAPDVKVDDAMWYMTQNFVRLCYDVTEVELSRAKLAFKTKLAANCADPETTLATVASTFTTMGIPLSPAELAARVDAVKLEDVKKTAYKFIHDNDHALAAVGPLHELPDYNWVRTASYNYHY